MSALRFTICFLAVFAFAAGEEPIFTIEDPRGDDHGSGVISYPSSSDFDRGDLDLVSFSAYPAKKGTWFEVRLANPVRPVGNRTSKLASVPLSEILAHDFFNLNIEIYVDTDGQKGSGATTTLPGRQIEVSQQTAWEKCIMLTPRPNRASSILKTHLIKKRRKEHEALYGSLKRDDQAAIKAQVNSLVDETFFFPERIRIRGRKISFLVPDEFLGGHAKADWSYLVMTTGCDPEQKMDVSFLPTRTRGLYLMPVGGGRPFESFQLEYGADPNTPPIVDVLHPQEGVQERLLDDFDAVVGRLAVLAGVRGDGTSPEISTKTRPTAIAVVAAPTSAPPKPEPKVKPIPVITPNVVAKPTRDVPAVTIEKPKRLVAKPQPKTVAEPQEEPKPEAVPTVDELLTEKPAEKKPEVERSVVERLKELEKLREEKLITDSEYRQLRRKILADL